MSVFIVTLKRLWLVALFLAPVLVYGQCTLNPSAIPGLSLTYQSTNLFNCSGVAYNPNFNLYYAVRAGNPGFPLETWSAIGTPLYTNAAGFDYRGMWWNPNTGQMEANGYNTYGIWASNLNASGYALNSGTVLFTGSNQPNSQSCGDYDPVNDQIIYYSNGRIYQYSRATATMVSNFLVTGLPVANNNLNSTTIFYTGCPGMEYGLLDYVNKRVYMVNRATGAYSGMSQLPGSAVTTGSFRCSWANGLLWLFDLGTRTWYSYDIFASVLSESMVRLEGEWNGSEVELNWDIESGSGSGRFEVERSEDGIEFRKVGEQEEAESSSFQMHDSKVGGMPDLYYRVRYFGQNGESVLSNIAWLSVSEFPDDFVQIYPNPVDAEVNGELSQPAAGSGTVELLDVRGKLVRVVDVEEGGRSFGISTSDLANGVYHLHYRDKVRNATDKILVQH